MSMFSETFRTMLWFLLCVGMAVGMIIFAIIYSLVTVVLKNIAWRELRLSISTLKLAK